MLRKFKQTPFGHFKDSPKIIVDIAFLDDLCERWEDGYKFRFGGDTGRVLEITLEGVGQILELSYRGHPIKLDIGENHTKFYKRHMRGTSLFSDSIKETFVTLLKKDDKTPEDEENGVRLWIYFLFVVFLLPNAKNTCPLVIMHFLDEMNMLRNFNWGEVILSFTMAHIRQCRHKVRTREVGGKRSNVLFTGCVAVLPDITPTYGSSVFPTCYAYSNKFQSRTPIQESIDDNGSNNFYYQDYNNPYVGPQQQTAIEDRTTYFYHGSYPRDTDEDNEEIEVDEDAFLESIIDRQGYEAQIEGAIDQNEQVKRKTLQVQISTFSLRKENSTFMAPKTNIFTITNMDDTNDEPTKEPEITSTIPRKRRPKEEKGKKKLITNVGRSNTTPIDLTGPTPNKTCSKTKSTLAGFCRGHFIKRANPKDIVQTTLTQHYGRPMVCHSKGTTKNGVSGCSKCVEKSSYHATGIITHIGDPFLSIINMDQSDFPMRLNNPDGDGRHKDTIGMIYQARIPVSDGANEIRWEIVIHSLGLPRQT